MVKIVSGVVGTSDIAKEVIKQGKGPKTTGKKFSQVLQKNKPQVDQANQTASASQINQTNPLNKVNQAKRIDQTQKIDVNRLKINQGIEKTTKDSDSSLKNLLGLWSKDTNAMNGLMDVAMKGGAMQPQEMILLQSATYKITFELDAMSKLAETASGAVKTTMQTQV